MKFAFLETEETWFFFFLVLSEAKIWRYEYMAMMTFVSDARPCVRFPNAE